MKPSPDEIEVSIFGPGYGECIVIHIGSGKWAIVDSCQVDNKSEPASITYLRSLGVSVETDVISVSASHWHDDHVKGLARTIDVCRPARLSFGSVLQSNEFVAFLCAHKSQPVQKLDRGGTELLRCLEAVVNSKRAVKPLNEDTLIFGFDNGVLAHNKRVELRALPFRQTVWSGASANHKRNWVPLWVARNSKSKGNKAIVERLGGKWLPEPLEKLDDLIESCPADSNWQFRSSKFALCKDSESKINESILELLNWSNR